jgi:cytochrome c-type biogenesis protein CcmH/NrfG
MSNTTAESQGGRWSSRQVYLLAATCLLIGTVLGYLFRGSEATSLASSRPQAEVEATPASTSTQAPPHPMPTLDEMKHMADKQAEPLLAQLKTNPTDPHLLAQVGDVYKVAHQFKDAADFYSQSLKIDPKNVPVRTALAACLYYMGDADTAIQQLQEALKHDAKDPNALFNLGVIKWQAKKDGSGALAAWQQLLKLNPDLDGGKRAQVEKLMGEVRKGGGS